jgi:hypothetical protein
VRRQDTKYEPGTRCIAGFEVRLVGGEGPLFGALVVTPEGVEAYRAEQDPALPALGAALSGQVVAARLGELVVPSSATVPECTVTLVRYKPGVRCVIRYDVLGAEGPLVFYAKLLASGAVAQAELLNSLWKALAGRPDGPDVLPVLACWAELGVVVQPAAPSSIELHAVATDVSEPEARRRAVLRQGGQALAALHELPLPGLTVRTFADELTELRGYLRAISAVDASLAAEYASVLARLETLDGLPDSAVASHGAFRTDQLLIVGERLAFIDLDTVSRAEPARDLGNLLAYLDWKRIRRPSLAAAVAMAGEAVLDGYADGRALPAPARLSAYRCASLLKIAGRRFRSLSLDEWPLIPELLTAAEECLSWTMLGSAPGGATAVGSGLQP